MKFRTRIDWLGTSLLAALGAGPLACGGSAVFENGTGGSGGSPPGSGGASSSGGLVVVGSGGVVSTGGASTGGAVSAGGGPMTNPFPCLNPSPLLDDPSTGYQTCQGGAIRRTTRATCPSRLPRPQPVPSANPDLDLCQYDADCTERPNGYCDRPGGDQPPTKVCGYGCVTDADCGSDMICVCGEPIGECRPATCTSGADCLPGFDCRTHAALPGCPGDAFACQTPADTCGSNLDCQGSLCSASSGTRQCQAPSCVIGRPFLVHGTERFAPCTARDDWRDFEIVPNLALSPDLRARLAAEWARAGQMEHASIAAFARFAMQLMSLGAPAVLIERATQAMADETAHAKICFALASQYGGTNVGPGALAVEGSLEAMSLAEIVTLTIREGCIGETVAALEAAEASEHATDPVTRAALRRISVDETAHAELAWRFLRWALETRGAELRRIVEAEFARALQSSQPPAAEVTASDRELLAHGVLPESVRSALRREALTRVVEPCARALCRAGLHESADLQVLPAPSLT